jgi:hypothetical protein
VVKADYEIIEKAVTAKQAIHCQLRAKTNHCFNWRPPFFNEYVDPMKVHLLCRAVASTDNPSEWIRQSLLYVGNSNQSCKLALEDTPRGTRINDSVESGSPLSSRNITQLDLKSRP